MEKNNINILIVGVGGQGVLLASEIISSVAMNAGLDVKKSEVHGMSQRGGVVSTHVKSVACVNRRLYHHDGAEITQEMVEMAYECCPVDLVAHGLPHRVLRKHKDH